MARNRQDHLDSAVVDLLDGTRLAEKVGLAFQLTTVDAGGAPHPALLSVGEVLAVSDPELSLALWPGSTTTGNLRERGHGLLTLVAAGVFFGIEMVARPAPGITVDGHSLARFEAAVTTVHRDEVGYAEVTSGITYRLHDPDAVLDRWRKTLAALRAESREDSSMKGASQ